MKEAAIDRERAIIAHDQSAEVAEPGDRAFYRPAPLVASQRPARRAARADLEHSAGQMALAYAMFRRLTPDLFSVLEGMSIFPLIPIQLF